MTDAASEHADGGQRELSIDPFNFYVGVASRIVGLGGSDPGHDPTYVFHTPYVQAARGPARFTVRFHNLAAKRGTLVLRVNMLPLDPKAHARQVNSERIALNRIAHMNGEASITFEGYRGMTFAVFGSIPDDTDVTADGITVTLDRPDDGSDYRGALADARSTVFGTDAARPSARLISIEPATLAEPVSQMCTANQFEEPVYAGWLERMREPMHLHRRQWEFVYILQVLHRYGMLRSGSRGVGFGCGAGPLPAVMASMGAQILATDLPAGDDETAARNVGGQHGSSVESLRRPRICDDATFDRNVTFRPVDMTVLPDDLVNFDFAWSAGAYEYLGSIGAGFDFVHASLDCLRPGGLAVHTSVFDPVPEGNAIAEGGAVLFRRRDMERLALGLISRGHEVAQIKLDAGDRPLDGQIGLRQYDSEPHLNTAPGRHATTAFGMIIRKAPSAF